MVPVLVEYVKNTYAKITLAKYFDTILNHKRLQLVFFCSPKKTRIIDVIAYDYFS